MVEIALKSSHHIFYFGNSDLHKIVINTLQLPNFDYKMLKTIEPAQRHKLASVLKFWI